MVAFPTSGCSFYRPTDHSISLMWSHYGARWQWTRTCHPELIQTPSDSNCKRLGWLKAVTGLVVTFSKVNDSLRKSNNVWKAMYSIKAVTQQSESGKGTHNYIIVKMTALLSRSRQTLWRQNDWMEDTEWQFKVIETLFNSPDIHLCACWLYFFYIVFNMNSK